MGIIKLRVLPVTDPDTACKDIGADLAIDLDRCMPRKSRKCRKRAGDASRARLSGILRTMPDAVNSPQCVALGGKLASIP